MNEEVFEKLKDVLREDYNKYCRTVDEVAEANPGLNDEELDALIVHEPFVVPEELQGYELEYATAVDAVYLEAVFDAMFEEG